MSGLVVVVFFSLSMRDMASRPPLPLRCPLSARCWFSSTLVENLLANFSAFGDKRNRNDLDSVGWFGSIIGCARASLVILWITRTPRRTIDRRVKRSSAWSAEIELKHFSIIFLSLEYVMKNVGSSSLHRIKWMYVYNATNDSYLNAREYHSSFRWVHPCIVWLVQVVRLVVPNWPLPMRMGMQSSQVARLTLAVFTS